MAHTLSSRCPASARRAGFTLIELMISIALALILMLGINTVFGLVGKTIGAGQVLSAATRDQRSAQDVMAADFRGAVVSDAPAFVIRSEQQWTWNSALDKSQDNDATVQTLNDVTTNGSLAALRAIDYGSRSHRLDRIGFFSRDFFYRQTGAGSNFVETANVPGGKVAGNSNEAWIVYGHLNLPDNSFATFKRAGDETPATNPNNYYATQWVLGRNAILLTPSLQAAASDTNVPGPPAQFIRNSGIDNLTPFSVNSAAADGNTVQSSRYDVGDASIDGFRIKVYKQQMANKEWWTTLTETRFQGTPILVKASAAADQAKNAAMTTPCFMPRCTSFIVEYAGDFITQDLNSGAFNAAGADGVVDFCVDASGVRRTRWYGFPRDTTGDAVINPAVDVVPYKDIAGAAGAWEREVPTGGPNYAAMAAGQRYTVGWGTEPVTLDSPRPTLIRVTLILDDPNGALPNGQTYEYVYRVR